MSEAGREGNYVQLHSVDIVDISHGAGGCVDIIVSPLHSAGLRHIVVVMLHYYYHYTCENIR